ncbi:class I SAM-dependent methyltransferase [Rhodobium gokarnense]|uniref:O-methyltransferase YrrM n=1 Tax=Rhodobium gokarnense TaxID=364296 RepID=A0ABT3HE11_9HYPH|nr:class I SAM-dependent methyltransferase [Rhodobium gokarnense]MCW2308631.1 putative O-methyltransferase YrrM [Rhodobium gokarnense]
MIGSGELSDDARGKLEMSGEAAFLDIWDAVRAHTAISAEYGLALFRACRYLAERPVPGSIVQCGIEDVGSAMVIMATLKAFGSADRPFFVLGSFEAATDGEVKAPGSVDALRETLAGTGYDMERVVFVDGDVTETLAKTRTGAAALVKLDAASYEVTLVEIDGLYQRLTQHGVIAVDGGDHWQGMRKALEAYFSRDAADNGYQIRKPLFQWIDFTRCVAIRSAPTPRLQAWRYDYVPPNLEKIDLLPHFPSLAETDTRTIGWRYLRKEVPHIFRTDLRSVVPNIGVLSMEEAHILYNLARAFAGKRGLEIGCHLGWSTAHILAGGIDLDVIDPRLIKGEHHDAVADSIRRSNPDATVRLWAGFSPSVVPAVAAADDRPFSFAFIDGNHDGEAPRLDVETVAPLCAETACLVFHDLVSPAVAGGFRAAGEMGWNTRIYNTMQVMGVAWRGDFEPFEHIPDERTPAFSLPGTSRV